MYCLVPCPSISVRSLFSINLERISQQKHILEGENFPKNLNTDLFSLGTESFNEVLAVTPVGKHNNLILFHSPENDKCELFHTTKIARVDHTHQVDLLGFHFVGRFFADVLYQCSQESDLHGKVLLKFIISTT